MDHLWRVVLVSVLVAECLGDHQAVTPRLATMKIETTTQCANCPKKTTTHHMTTLHTNHTTTTPSTAHTNHTTEPPTTAHSNHTTEPPTTARTNHTTEPPTTAHTNYTSTPSNHTSHHTSAPLTNHTTPSPTPSATEYFVNGTSGVCLRMKAIFMLTLNISKLVNYTIPSPPDTKASGNCSNDTAQLKLTFAGGSLDLTFKKDNKDGSFYLGSVYATVRIKDVTYIGSSTSLKEMETPLGRYFSCEDVNVMANSTLNVLLKDVKAQAFKLDGGNYGQELKCTDPRHRNNTVPIVVGIVLLVLIIIVVVAYLIARKFGKRNAGYQPL